MGEAAAEARVVIEDERRYDEHVRLKEWLHAQPTFDVAAGFDVNDLPRRLAHATHALMAAANVMEGNGPGPLTSAEVCVYDAEALSPRHTGAALREARKKGLVMYVPGGEGYWTPTNFALGYKREFEDRYLRETEN